MKKSMAMAAAIAALGIGEAYATAYTSASYVQDGLIAQWDADSIRLRAGAQLKFTLPADGFAATPITTAGGVRVVADADETMQAYSVVPSKLVIDPSAFDADRRGRKQTLLSCATASAESLQRLVDNVEFINASRHGTVTIEDGGTRLVYNGLSGSTAVFVR